MDASTRMEFALYIICISAIQTIMCDQFEEQNITASIGRGNNITVYVVNDSVTWYTAREACAEEIDGAVFKMHGHTFSNYIANAFSKIDSLHDQLFWISRIKSKDDNNVYRGNNCNEENFLTNFVHEIEGTNNQTRCLGFTSSNSTTYGTDDCYNKHPYICLKPKSVEQPMDPFYNVTVRFDNSTARMILYFNLTHDECKQQCKPLASCVAINFDFVMQECFHIDDTSGNSDTLIRLNIQNSTSQNILEVKIGKRINIEIWQPLSSRTDEEGTFFSYTSIPVLLHSGQPGPFPEQTTTVETVVTEQCTCGYHSTMTVNSTELQEWIQNITNILTVDKTQLSSFTRKLTSAKDSRSSSTALGFFGAIFLSSVLLFICIGDVLIFSNYCKNMYCKLVQS